MCAMWDRFGAARVLARARAAELRGDLAQAVALFAEAERPEEVARVMVLRGDAEADPAARMQHYVQAAALAPEGSPVATLARRKRATLLLATSGERALTGPLRHDLLEAARELEALGELEVAADAYGRAGDVEGQARALARAGDVDKLDELLRTQQARDRRVTAQREQGEGFRMLASSGRRREAAALARAADDATIREMGREIEERRVSGPVVKITVRGQRLRLVMGDEVTVGRVAALSVASAALSRQHLAIRRRGDEIVVRDLGSRNGTTLRGLALGGEVPVADGLELRLGGQLPLVLRPTDEVPGAVAIDLAGERTLAPLGPAGLGVGAWTLRRDGASSDQAWVELVTGDRPPAFLAGLSLGPRVELLTGDAFATDRAGDPVLVVEDD
jgi:hypothetical protein